MNDLVPLLFISTYALMFIFFFITCINSIRGFRHLKKYSQRTAEFHQNASERTQILYEQYTRSVRDLQDSVESLENKIDELRLQVGIVNGRMGDYSRMINIPPPHMLNDVTERKKPGWPAGKPRGPKKPEEESTPQ